MAGKKAEELIRIYSRVKKESPSRLIRSYNKLKGTGDKSRYLKTLKDELLKIKSTKLKGKTKEDLQKDAKKWYQNILKQAKKSDVTKFQIGYFYHYTYKSDYFPDLLSHYDTKPLIFLFDKYRKGGKLYLLGLNFHWMAKGERIKILSSMLKSFPNDFENDKPLKIKYDEIKHGKYVKSYVAIRKYIRKNIKKRVLRIPNMEMLNVVNLPSDKFTGISVERAVQLTKAKRTYRSDVLLNREKLNKFVKKYGAEKGKIKYDTWKKNRRKETYKRF